MQINPTSSHITHFPLKGPLPFSQGMALKTAHEQYRGRLLDWGEIHRCPDNALLNEIHGGGRFTLLFIHLQFSNARVVALLCDTGCEIIPVGRHVIPFDKEPKFVSTQPQELHAALQGICRGILTEAAA